MCIYYFSSADIIAETDIDVKADLLMALQPEIKVTADNTYEKIFSALIEYDGTYEDLFLDTIYNGDFSPNAQYIIIDKSQGIFA